MIKAFFAAAFALTAAWVVFLGWLTFLGIDALVRTSSASQPVQQEVRERGWDKVDYIAK